MLPNAHHIRQNKTDFGLSAREVYNFGGCQNSMKTDFGTVSMNGIIGVLKPSVSPESDKLKVGVRTAAKPLGVAQVQPFSPQRPLQLWWLPQFFLWVFVFWQQSFWQSFEQPMAFLTSFWHGFKVILCPSFFTVLPDSRANFAPSQAIARVVSVVVKTSNKTTLNTMESHNFILEKQ